MSYSVGQKVCKRSGKPFKKAEGASEALKYDFIDHLCDNPIDPKNRPSAFLQISKSIVSQYQLKECAS